MEKKIGDIKFGVAPADRRRTYPYSDEGFDPEKNVPAETLERLRNERNTGSQSYAELLERFLVWTNDAVLDVDKGVEAETEVKIRERLEDITSRLQEVN